MPPRPHTCSRGDTRLAPSRRAPPPALSLVSRSLPRGPQPDSGRGSGEGRGSVRPLLPAPLHCRPGEGEKPASSCHSGPRRGVSSPETQPRTPARPQPELRCQGHPHWTRPSCADPSHGHNLTGCLPSFRNPSARWDLVPEDLEPFVATPPVPALAGMDTCPPRRHGPPSPRTTPDVRGGARVGAAPRGEGRVLDVCVGAGGGEDADHAALSCAESLSSSQRPLCRPWLP